MRPTTEATNDTINRGSYKRPQCVFEQQWRPEQRRLHQNGQILLRRDSDLAVFQIPLLRHLLRLVAVVFHAFARDRSAETRQTQQNKETQRQEENLLSSCTARRKDIELQQRTTDLIALIRRVKVSNWRNDVNGMILSRCKAKWILRQDAHATTQSIGRAEEQRDREYERGSEEKGETVMA